MAFASPMNLVNTTQLSSPGARGQVVTVTNSSMNANLVQAGGLQGGGMGMVGLGAGGVTLATGSQVAQVSPDMIAKSTADVSSPSPVPYVFGRGRKSGALEKVVERRHRRMIKNRESAARSRARKQVSVLVEPLYIFSAAIYYFLLFIMELIYLVCQKSIISSLLKDAFYDLYS